MISFVAHVLLVSSAIAVPTHHRKTVSEPQISSSLAATKSIATTGVSYSVTVSLAYGGPSSTAAPIATSTPSSPSSTPCSSSATAAPVASTAAPILVPTSLPAYQSEPTAAPIASSPYQMQQPVAYAAPVIDTPAQAPIAAPPAQTPCTSASSPIPTQAPILGSYPDSSSSSSLPVSNSNPSMDSPGSYANNLPSLSPIPTASDTGYMPTATDAPIYSAGKRTGGLEKSVSLVSLGTAMLFVFGFL